MIIHDKRRLICSHSVINQIRNVTFDPPLKSGPMVGRNSQRQADMSRDYNATESVFESGSKTDPVPGVEESRLKGALLHQRQSHRHQAQTGLILDSR